LSRTRRALLPPLCHPERAKRVELRSSAKRSAGGIYKRQRWLDPSHITTLTYRRSRFGSASSLLSLREKSSTSSSLGNTNKDRPPSSRSDFAQDDTAFVCFIFARPTMEQRASFYKVQTIHATPVGVGAPTTRSKCFRFFTLCRPNIPFLQAKTEHFKETCVLSRTRSALLCPILCVILSERSESNPQGAKRSAGGIYKRLGCLCLSRLTTRTHRRSRFGSASSLLSLREKSSTSSSLVNINKDCPLSSRSDFAQDDTPNVSVAESNP